MTPRDRRACTHLLPAGTYAHPTTGEPLTLGEWTAAGWRYWGDTARGDWAALVAGDQWRIYLPFADGPPWMVAEGTGTRDDADRALLAWLRGEHIQPRETP